MPGWDALKNPEQLSLFQFEEFGAKQMREQLLNSMPKRLFGLASENPVTVIARRGCLDETSPRRPRPPYNSALERVATRL